MRKSKLVCRRTGQAVPDQDSEFLLKNRRNESGNKLQASQNSLANSAGKSKRTQIKGSGH